MEFFFNFSIKNIIYSFCFRGSTVHKCTEYEIVHSPWLEFWFHLKVSTSTGVKSHYFNLHVMVPTAFILGSDEYHTQAGNAISLVCIIENVRYISE